jgi:hypothetical protein
VLLDEDGSAAEIVGTNKTSMLKLASPGQLIAGARARTAGNKQRNAGRRPFQLGATLVVGPGDKLLYSDFEDFAGDHANLDEVLGAVREAQ